MLFRNASLVLALSAVGAGCSVPVIADLGVNAGNYTISANRITVPEAFRDTSTMTVRRVPCTSDDTCPQVSGGVPMVRCDAQMECDPEPFPFDLASDVIDLNSSQEIRNYGDNVTVLQIRAIRYEASDRGLRNSVGPTELYWGSESAASISSREVLLGTVPVVTLDGSSSQSGEVTLDMAGAGALADYLLHTSRRIKLFARPTIDLAPGGPLPMGEVALAVTLSVHVEGQLVR